MTPNAGTTDQQGQSGVRQADGRPWSSVAPPTVSLPKGGGAIRGIGEKFGANPVTGTGGLSVPLAVSPGRSGFGPSLALEYDSGAGNGPFGFGWSLALPSVTRKTDKGLPRYFAEPDDVFVLSGSEDLVPVLDEVRGTWRPVELQQSQGNREYVVRRYRPRIEGLFARIERWTDLASGETHWRSTTSDNVTSNYGTTAESRIADPDDAGRVFSWLICESYDDKGNAIVYEYKAENDDGVDLTAAREFNRTPRGRSANRYLKRIRYGNKVSRLMKQDLALADWMFEVVFDYGDHDADQPVPTESRPWTAREDPFSNHRASFEIRTYRLCERVLMFHHFPLEQAVGWDCLVRSTDLTYRSDPVASVLTSVTQSGYRRTMEGGYRKKSVPPVEFTYSDAAIDDQVRHLGRESLENLPTGVDDSMYRWVDLDGEGLSGVLADHAAAWLYKSNLGDGRFGPTQVLSAKPAGWSVTGGRQELLDLAGDGQLDLVDFAGATPGFFERTPENGWAPLRTFRCLPNVDWDDPALRMVDLSGDGHADILIGKGNVASWYASLAEDGFDTARSVHHQFDDNEGPQFLTGDPAHATYLADMSGDGLADLVRIANGEVSYWPNLGYGRFGKRVSMDHSPWLDEPDQFDHRLLRLADIDGSGTTDLIYLHRDGVRIYANRAGNSWSAAQTLSPAFPTVDRAASVTTIDLLGNGTACLVWSSPLPREAPKPLCYIDLMGGQKPHLLIEVRNNLGAETLISYAPSTRFYLADQATGRPWITRLPFPVHVVERVETVDRISGNRLVTRYAYHHGFFDGVEREFRGFGMVEQWDTETFAALTTSAASNVDQATAVPPVLTRTWFHTGGPPTPRVSQQFANEYYRETDDGPTHSDELLLPDTVLPETVRRFGLPPLERRLSADEERQACRALKGSVLHQEIYALDGTEAEGRPYVVTENVHTIELLQPAIAEHAVFFVHPREAITAHYERALYPVAGAPVADPRVNHQLTMAVDDFGNVLRSVLIAYGRRHGDPDPALTAADRLRQRVTHVVLTEATYTNGIDASDAYRKPHPAESKTYEVLGLKPNADRPGSTNLFEFQELADRLESVVDEIPYLQWNTDPDSQSAPARRLIENTRSRYRRDDLTGPLEFGVLEPLALPFESYRLAMPDDLVADLYGPQINDATLTDVGYARDGHGWWIPAGQVFYSPGAGSDAAELAEASNHFFLPRRFRDPFEAMTDVSYDAYDLFVHEIRDPLDNRTNAEHDYRVLQPRLVVDANRNRTEAAFDTLGLVVGTAVMGKQTENLGDSLAGFDADPDEVALAAYLADPLASPHALLGDATTRMVYDLFAFSRTHDDPQPQPAVVATLAREAHVSDLRAGQRTAIQHRFTYSDGFGREIQRKVQAEPGPVDDGGPDVNPRWVGSGWTIFNNKAKPVRRYEPFFSTSPRFEFAVVKGVSSVLCYDPLVRVVATIHPNATWEKVTFDTWHQATWDVNDTSLLNPGSDPDVEGYVLPFLTRLGTWIGWHARRASGQLGDAERAAAEKAAAHADTASRMWLDTLGRPFLTVERNRAAGVDTLIATRTSVDIEGNEREVVDALGRIVMRYGYDMLGNRILQASMEAGERLQLYEVTGKLAYSWNSRGFRTRVGFDALRRPTHSFVQDGDFGGEVLEQLIEYGDGQPADQRNLRTRILRQRDAAGVVTNEAYDFKGNLRSTNRQLSVEYKTTMDWSGTVPLENPVYTTRTTHDALNRPTTLTAPDGSVVRPRYNEANLLERLDGSLVGGDSITFVTDIDYNARGQRSRCVYGNGTRTEYEYDPLTFRLSALRTIRGNDPLQDLNYTYDPVGNITHTRDNAQQTIFFRNRIVDASSEYTYDATYRLIEATGREHLGQVAGAGAGPVPPSPTDAPRVGLPHPGDGNAMGRYIQRYLYDEVGNFLEMVHQGTDPANPGWGLRYHYDEPSPLEPGRISNRLTTTSAGDLTSQSFSYDAHGNTTSMPQLPLMHWNHRDQLQASARQVVTNGGVPETTYYVYDAAGQRVRKITERQAAAGRAPTRMRERVYIGGFEIYRGYDGNGSTFELERTTLHIMDDARRIALVETRTVGSDASVPRVTRYQIGNHLGSPSLEVDDRAQIISYEEYYPYGSTSYQAVRNQTETKRYRYIGKERDEESALVYIDARYYPPWIGRWINCDPIGLTDCLNLYAFTRANPLTFIDPTGTESWLLDAISDAHKSQESGYKPSPVGDLDTGDPPSLFLPYSSRTPSRGATERSGDGSSDEYHGVGGWLHRYFYEPNQRAYARWMNVGDNLASSWGDRVPVAGHVAGYVVGTVPYAAGLVGRTATSLLQFITPKTEQEAFLFVMVGPAVGFGRIGTAAENQLVGKAESALAEASAGAAESQLAERAESALAEASAEAAETGGDITRVGRWMGKTELDQMQKSGTVVERGGGRTYVGTTPAASDYKAGRGYYVEFDVPSRSLHPASQPNWAQIPGPNVGTTRFGPIPRGMPPATNIQVVRGP